MAAVVARQKRIGIELVNDGEYGQRYDYGGWWTYVLERLDGPEARRHRDVRHAAGQAATGREVALASIIERRDWRQFAGAYADPAPGCALPDPPAA